ncbi:DNA mismatch repair protein MutL [Guyanagaster necrorhizus]|uniref:DNA mismatch repair protein MutL n=1 Tax=Guyanagaster necrorhizus TaxID=856835 RepID=A0A9P8ATB8_9AGAR|nr:DNA mismatch repair protein MutL [Guyanagaster necrorhizus MCA 3950]KAG7446826.1 DNA mismatch repair protein MutL [Guyanagaster necrorhizus MCA 3950]
MATPNIDTGRMLEKAVHEPDGPLPIRRLQESLINRIAAGEVIHRPASALKELVENCLDAGSTSIRVTVKDGGMKLLQIQDNGCGIRRADLPILAERFTTSKLSTFSDLSRISTYGFRGEALASISHVAHLTVVTKTKTETCAWKASYSDGKLAETHPGQTSDPKPCAGNDGTTITIEDLFYNMPTRLSALRSASEEYSRILDVLTKYAIHNPNVSFVCKKAGSAAPDLSTPSSSSTPRAIRMLYGHSISKELLHSEVSNSDDDGGSESWSAEAHFTNANYQAKRIMFLLFINHRLVESSRMKRALEGVYNGILPKGSFPFIYLSLTIDPRSVDVNVHPTKKEVYFLNEEAIVERICDALLQTLTAKNHSRVFEYQTLLTGGVSDSHNQVISKNGKGKEREVDPETEEAEENALSSTQAESRKKTYSHSKVRTSLQDRTLDSMFPIINPGQIEGPSGTAENVLSPGMTKTRGIKESECILTSVQNLRHSVGKGKHRLLTEILEKHIFVGIVDLNRCLSLVQHSTKLYLVNHAALAEELFFQLALRQFGDMAKLKLEPPPPLRKLVQIAVDAEDTTEDSKLTKTQIVDRIVDILVTRRDMLAEYFSLDISPDGLVESLPLLLRDYTPNLDKVPYFLMRLGPQVNWTAEKECFESFLRELAYFYVPGPAPCFDPAATKTDEQEAQDKAERWQIQHILFPAMRRYLIAPKSLLERDVVQIADLPNLYKVFERC